MSEKYKFVDPQGIVDEAEAYLYSSARDYYGTRRGLIDIKIIEWLWGTRFKRAPTWGLLLYKIFKPTKLSERHKTIWSQKS